MKPLEKRLLEELRNNYPVGCKVELIEMKDSKAPPKGTIGRVVGVDSLGSIRVVWETGSTLSLIYGEDLCKKV